MYLISVTASVPATLRREIFVQELRCVASWMPVFVLWSVRPQLVNDLLEDLRRGMLVRVPIVPALIPPRRLLPRVRCFRISARRFRVLRGRGGFRIRGRRSTGLVRMRLLRRHCQMEFTYAPYAAA